MEALESEAVESVSLDEAQAQPRPIGEVLLEALGQWQRGELDEVFWNGVFRD